MAARIEHRAEYPHDVATVWAGVTGQDALRARLERLGGKSATVLSYVETAGDLRYELRQGIDAEKLPSAVRALHKGDLIVRRDHEWRRSDDGYAGTVTVAVEGVPGEITARTEVRPSGGQTVLRYSGEVRVLLPLVGGKLEQFVAEQVTNLLGREAELIAKWLAEHSS